MAAASLTNNMVIITLASRVHSASRDLLTSLKQLKLEKRSKLMRKELQACNTLRIKFGSNFIDNGTPLVMQDVCINQIMSLVLLKRSRVN